MVNEQRSKLDHARISRMRRSVQKHKLIKKKTQRR
jgi:hypothetical protein